jgi:hypothetical protein
MMSRRVWRSGIKWAFWAFLAAYGVAVLLLLQEKDPRSLVVLMALGLPWNLLLGWWAMLPLVTLGVLAPLANVAILYWLWKRQTSAQ